MVSELQEKQRHDISRAFCGTPGLYTVKDEYAQFAAGAEFWKRGKSIHESFRGSILDSIIEECKRKLSVEVFGASTKMVDSETPKCEQQAVPAKSARRKECDHVRSAFRFDK